MPVRETIPHDPVYEFFHQEVFGKQEEKPALEIYLPNHIKNTAVLQDIMRVVWQAEVSLVWARIVDDMALRNVCGDFVEFGVFSGGSFRRLLNLFSGKGLITKFWGFDSFEGLPAPSPLLDQSIWKKGQFKATRAQAWEHITAGLETTDHIELVQGWFSESLLKYAHVVKRIAFARIDCDVWSSTVEALTFLEGRLVDGAILYFDDWTFDVRTGETKAFFEFVRRTQLLYRFEKLFVMSQCAFSVRVKLLDTADIP